MNVILQNYVTKDISDIYTYISRDSYRIAEKFILKILDYIYTLSLFPEIGKLVIEEYNIRKLVYGNYIILYKLDYYSNKIIIIRIFNSKQDINIILKRIEKYI